MAPSRAGAPVSVFVSLSMADILRRVTKAKGAFPPLDHDRCIGKTRLSPSGQRPSNKYERQSHGSSPLVRRKLRKDRFAVKQFHHRWRSISATILLSPSNRV